MRQKKAQIKMGHDSKLGSMFNFRDQFRFGHFKVWGEIGEKEITGERERIHAETQGLTLERILSSQRKLCCYQTMLHSRLYKQCSSFNRRYKEHQKTTVKGLSLDKTGCSTKISRTGLMSNLWWVFFQLYIIKNLWNDIVDNYCLGATFCPSLRSILASYQ